MNNRLLKACFRNSFVQKNAIYFNGIIDGDAIETYLRDINSVTYVEANDSGMASNFTKTLVDVADARGGTNGTMSYKVFTYSMLVPASAKMTFKVTI